MDKYSRYYGTMIFVTVFLFSVILGFNILNKAVQQYTASNRQLGVKTNEYNQKLEQKKIVEAKLASLRLSATTLQKKVYAPLDSDLGNDTLFFTLYNDLIEMIHSNSIKIKSMEYLYNPENDPFVKFSKDLYFVSEVNMQLVANYTNLGKFVQELIQYPYYIRLQNISIKPYAKDKKILIADVNLKLYAKTIPEVDTTADTVRENQ